MKLYLLQYFAFLKYFSSLFYYLNYVREKNKILTNFIMNYLNYKYFCHT